MLYHVPDLDRGIAELARVLRPGGTLVAVTNSRVHLSSCASSSAAAHRRCPSRENGEELVAALRAVRARTSTADSSSPIARRSRRTSARRSRCRRSSPTCQSGRRAVRRAPCDLDLRRGEGVTTLDDPEIVRAQYASDRGSGASSLWNEREARSEGLRWQAIASCDDIERGLGEIARVLEPGGAPRREHELAAPSRRGLRPDRLSAGLARAALQRGERRGVAPPSLRPTSRVATSSRSPPCATARPSSTISASMMAETQPVPDDVSLPLRVGSRGVVFVATK